MKQKTFSQHIENLEKKFGLDKKKSGYQVPGTSLCRVVTERGIEWTLSVGLFQERKRFFTAMTIEECLKKAEEF